MGIASSTVDLFADLVSRQDEAISLPAAALAVARVRYPHLDMRPTLETLRRFGKDAISHTRQAVGRRGIERLNQFVFGTLEFRGNREDYYDPRNCFLNDVVERRTGIPITLSLVYIELAATCGMTIEGIGFPGHFLVRETKSGALLDPFNDGIELEEEDVRRLLSAQNIDASARIDEYIEPVSKRQTLLRLVNNLSRYFSQEGDAEALGKLQAMTEILLRTEDSAASLMVQ
jgi:regulator of sirC expression with transglutaminase-like and TPR domain